MTNSVLSRFVQQGKLQQPTIAILTTVIKESGSIVAGIQAALQS
jgi:hypothetical protein